MASLAGRGCPVEVAVIGGHDGRRRQQGNSREAVAAFCGD